MGLGVAIITFNEERNIERVIKSILSIADEIVIVDSFSTDATKEISDRYPVKFIQRKWSGYADQKQFALDQLTSEWVLALDADEEIENLSLHKIMEVSQRDEDRGPRGYLLTRKLHFMGRELHYGKGVDYPLRLFRRKFGKYEHRLIHETIKVSGDVEILNASMIHYSSESIRERLVKIRRDNSLELENYNHGQGRLLKVIITPVKYAFFNIIKRSAYKDGLPGILLSLLFCYQLFDLELNLWLNRKVKIENNSHNG